ncbi:hypothetical protein Fot_57374 [Forsythia ovata]|uniref:Uncharacterized protein n=1 Tax=Forsythia ovata TaxID=205694 RepID=A0ABD1NVP8_9LAMI
MLRKILRQRMFDSRVEQIFTKNIVGVYPEGWPVGSLPQVPTTRAHPSIYNLSGQGASDTGGGTLPSRFSPYQNPSHFHPNCPIYPPEERFGFKPRFEQEEYAMLMCLG